MIDRVNANLFMPGGFFLRLHIKYILFLIAYNLRCLINFFHYLASVRSGDYSMRNFAFDGRNCDKLKN